MICLGWNFHVVATSVLKPPVKVEDTSETIRRCWWSERGEWSHSQVLKIEICDIYYIYSVGI